MITPSSSLHESTSKLEEDHELLYPRRGSGGGAGGGAGHGGGRGGGGSRNRNGTSPTTTVPPGTYPGQPVFSLVPRSALPFQLNGKGLHAVPFGDGTKRAWKGYFAKSHPFEGRECGGGSRGVVYGNTVYGSGYPGETERGVEGRGFPFFFYPLTFPAATGPAYLYREAEYGTADDPSRPGGPLFQFSVYPQVTYQSTPPYKFHIVADNTTAQFLNVAISYSCTQYNASPGGITITTPVPYMKNSSNSSDYLPSPEDVVQFYRASSVALFLEGYNNTELVFNPTSTSLALAPQVLAPNISRNFVDCVNHTIGMSVPLVGGALVARGAPNGVYAGAMLAVLIWVSLGSWVL
ncbi:hypothetical protein CVT24_003051 [Panaeolus cyanescens]|uniref:Uncharacterized protein n=1 Tax=Panaeolus cyanescens TaxID=181874 RepID=A0A409W8R8_9AGAR|nr:hypothetical protein CVT24_003051 [Panaeolus cyanescens]